MAVQFTCNQDFQFIQASNDISALHREIDSAANHPDRQLQTSGRVKQDIMLARQFRQNFSAGLDVFSVLVQKLERSLNSMLPGMRYQWYFSSWGISFRNVSMFGPTVPMTNWVVRNLCSPGITLSTPCKSGLWCADLTALPCTESGSSTRLTNNCLGQVKSVATTRNCRF